jgi:hypothetical protein
MAEQRGAASPGGFFTINNMFILFPTCRAINPISIRIEKELVWFLILIEADETRKKQLHSHTRLHCNKSLQSLNYRIKPL